MTDVLVPVTGPLPAPPGGAPAGAPAGAHKGEPVPWRAGAWWWITGAGLALWVLVTALTVATLDAELVVILVLLGSFVPPVAFAAWAFEHPGREITVPLLFSAVTAGGVLGLAGAVVLHTLPPDPGGPVLVAAVLVEITAKLLALTAISHGLTRRRRRDGLVLGAALGLGFAAFESAGYILGALMVASAGDLGTGAGAGAAAGIGAEVARGTLAPLGHGLWTAVLGGALFAALRREHPGAPRRGRFAAIGALIASGLGAGALYVAWTVLAGATVAAVLGVAAPPGGRPGPGQLPLLSGLSGSAGSTGSTLNPALGSSFDPSVSSGLAPVLGAAVYPAAFLAVTVAGLLWIAAYVIRASGCHVAAGAAAGDGSGTVAGGGSGAVAGGDREPAVAPARATGILR